MDRRPRNATNRAMLIATRATADLRRRTGTTRAELARRCGVSTAAIWRIETGRTDRVPISTVFDVLEELGADFDLVVRPPFLAERSRQRDAGHARMSAYVRRELTRQGWLVAQEVEIGTPRSRGWIDLLAFHPDALAAICGELKTDLADVGAVQRQMGWYEREAWAAARRLGWQPRRIVSALILLDTEINHSRVMENSLLMRQEFPLRAPALAGWVKDPIATDLPPGRALATVDPLSRRTDWLRPTRSDGRRSPAADQDYAGFMARARARRRSGRGV